jgi:hypothetical protein
LPATAPLLIEQVSLNHAMDSRLVFKAGAASSDWGGC